MKHIVKVETLQNIPETRPLIAMDNNGNLFWRGKLLPPKFLYGSADPEEIMLLDPLDFYTYDGTMEYSGENYFKWKKHSNGIYTDRWILTDTIDLWNVSEENPYIAIGDVLSDESPYTNKPFKIRMVSNELNTDLLDPFTIQVYNATSGNIPHHDNLNANGHSYVDLGLPSGAMWSTSLVGATNEDTVESWCGNYYAWGETETKADYSWTNYKYGDWTLTKYCPSDKSEYWNGDGNADNKIELELIDDVARKSFGGDWRIPSLGLYVELLSYTTNEWIENYNNIERLNGRVFTSKINGNTLFIPAAGYRNGSGIYDVGSFCRLWSSCLSLGYPYNAYRLSFDSNDIYMYDNDRFQGFCVCPVLY